ncbi:MAG: DUF3127 domain-containing protein [Verrucomicrobia bacterium]|nr:DUF3127 domain-containing protein [Verrucomicrobiota bacterium]
MPTYDMTGSIKEIMQEVSFSSGFNKREFVVVSEGDRFPQDIKFECVKEKCALLNDFQQGQRVTVTFDLRGNLYNERYFVNLTAWRIQAADQAASPAPGRPQQPPRSDGPPLDQLQEPETEPDEAEFPF